MVKWSNVVKTLSFCLTTWTNEVMWSQLCLSVQQPGQMKSCGQNFVFLFDMVKWSNVVKTLSFCSTTWSNEVMWSKLCLSVLCLSRFVCLFNKAQLFYLPYCQAPCLIKYINKTSNFHACFHFILCSLKFLFFQEKLSAGSLAKLKVSQSLIFAALLYSLYESLPFSKTYLFK